MAPSSTLCIGMDVHPDPIAVAYVAQAHGAAGTSLGPMGTRQCDSDHLVRTMLSKAKPLLCVSDAGPCGDGLSRYLTQKDDDGGVVAPSRMPQTAGDCVTTNRRDAVPLARLARAGALPAVYVPQGEAAAMRALTRAREETLSECQDAQCRRKAFLLRRDSRSSGPANWGPALAGGSQRSSALPRRSQAGAKHLAERSRHAPSTSTPGDSTRWSKPCRRSVVCPARWPSPWAPPWAPCPAWTSHAH
jgi:hypothetical protein